MEHYRQYIHIEGKCMEDIFNLPCIVAIQKYRNDKYCYLLSDGSHAYTGDWICEDYSGHWHALSDFQLKSSLK